MSSDLQFLVVELSIGSNRLSALLYIGMQIIIISVIKLFSPTVPVIITGADRSLSTACRAHS